MLNVWFIRHAQSQSNAGERTADPELIELTSIGREQAAQIPVLFDRAPDLLVSSPYLRAQQTAQYLIDRFPEVPHETWPVQEYTYLNRERCLNTTLAERIPMAHEYWERNDPQYVDGDRVESFAGLMGRVDAMWKRLAAQPDGKWMVIFTHAMFIRAALWHWLYEGDKSTETGMKRFRNFLRTYPIPNASVLKVRLDGEFWHGVARTDHIPIHLRKN